MGGHDPAAGICTHIIINNNNAADSSGDRQVKAGRQPDGHDKPLSSRPDGGQAPVSVGRLVTRFALAGLPALAAAVVITAVASVRIGTRLGIDDAKRINLVASLLVEEQGLSDALLRNDPQAVNKVNDVVQRYVIRGSLVRVKVWAADGTIVYSNERRLIGMRFELGDVERKILQGGTDVKADVSDLKLPENQFETDKKLLEVYSGIKTPGGTEVMFESYFRYDDVSRTGRNLWGQFAPIAVGALLLLELVQIPFAVSLARRVRAGQLQRERLLLHAIDSSDIERRRIASDLHDGAVQDLTGVSLSLSAGARTATDEVTHKLLSDTGGKIRETVKSLRSMLVNIYPPNLYEEGLVNALADLLAGLHNRAVATHLTVDPEAQSLSHENVALIYRSAQEAIRNVTAHAQATDVTLTVHLTPTHAVLTVEDDGKGFDSDIIANRQLRGHVGLRTLVGLVTDAGGDIEIRSKPGEGTLMKVSVRR